MEQRHRAKPRRKKGGAPRWCTPLIGAGGSGQWQQKLWAGVVVAVKPWAW
jgi:hypothetical protein